MNKENDYEVDGSSALALDNEENNDNVIPLEDGLSIPALKDDVHGKKINEKGEIEDTATKKTLRAVGRGTAAYFTKGESLKYDQQITNNRIGDNLIGVVSDELDEIPGIEQMSETLDEYNIPEVANVAMDTAGNAMNGDVVGTIKSGSKTIKETKKTAKSVIKKLLIAFAPLIFFIIMFVVILYPMIGGSLDATNGETATNGNVNNSSSNNNDNSSTIPDDDGNYLDPSAVDNMDISLTQEQLNYLINNIPNWENLSQFRKNVIMAAFSCVGKVSYSWGSRPTAPGKAGTNNGLDCSGFVSWAIWTASGKYFNQTTEALAANIDKNGLVSITESALQPGDFVIVRRPNNTGHALIYAGNNRYIHLAGKDQKAKISSYEFKPQYTVYYARYAG